MTKIFKCLNDACNKEFPDIFKDGRDHSFCSTDCYKSMRKKVGNKGIKLLTPIIIREEADIPKKHRASKKSKKTIAIKPPVVEPIIKDEVPVTTPEPEQNEAIASSDDEGVIAFDDLSILELKSLLDALLGERDSLLTENDQLTAERGQLLYDIDLLKIQITEYQHTPDNLPDLVNEFITNAIRLELKQEEKPIAPPEEPLPSSSYSPSSPVKEPPAEPPVEEPEPTGMCALVGCENPVFNHDVFCSTDCARSALPNHGTMRMNSGKMIHKSGFNIRES